MAMALRIAVFGTGFWARYQIAAWRELAGVEIVALYNRTQSKAQALAEHFGIAAVYTDPEALIDQQRLDAIDIITDVNSHAQFVALAARHGIPVICQKPLAPNLQEATELAAEVADQTRLMVHENWRFRGYYRDAAAWLREGRIGNVRQAQLTLLTSGVLPGPDGLCPALERQPFMRRERRMLVAEVLIHHLDTLRMLLGPLRVTAARLSRSSDQLVGEDGAVIQLEAGNGAAVSVFASFAAHGHPAAQVDRLVILGDEGAINLDGPRLACSGASPAELLYDLAVEYQGSYDRTIAHFVKALRDNTPFETAPQDNLETLQVVEECYRLSGWEAAR